MTTKRRGMTALTMGAALALSACHAPPPAHTSDTDDGIMGAAPPGVDRTPAPVPETDPLAGRKDKADPPGDSDGYVGEKFKFSAWGDSRPDNKPKGFEDDYKNCVKPIMEAIFTDAYARGAQFMIGSGDYINAYMPDPGQDGDYLDEAAWETGCKTQYTWALQVADIFRENRMGKRKVYFALGNHEALGWTDLNSTTYDEKPNIKLYMSMMIPGLKPWYSFTIKSGTDKSTLSKFIFIAPNTWNADQKMWLDNILKVKTKYTFIIRHESNDDHGCIAPGMKEMWPMIKDKFTLLIEGHTHEYLRPGPSGMKNEVIAGNGGAPFVQAFRDSGNPFHGYITVEEIGDVNGKLLVRTWNVAKPAMPIDSFKVAPDGTVSEESFDATQANLRTVCPQRTQW